MRLRSAGHLLTRPLNCGVRRHMMERAEIKRMWTDHRRAVFPASARGRDVRGVDLVLLDSLAAGCIDSFVNGGGNVEPSKLALLENLATQLRNTVPSLELGEREYFERLQRLAQAVLATVPGHGG